MHANWFSIPRATLVLVGFLGSFVSYSNLASGAEFQWLLTQWRYKSIEELPDEASPEGRVRTFNGGYGCSFDAATKEQKAHRSRRKIMTCKNGSATFRIAADCGPENSRDAHELELVGAKGEDNDVIVFECRYCAAKCGLPSVLATPHGYD